MAQALIMIKLFKIEVIFGRWRIFIDAFSRRGLFYNFW